jgi:hypothetical protein
MSEKSNTFATMKIYGPEIHIKIDNGTLYQFIVNHSLPIDQAEREKNTEMVGNMFSTTKQYQRPKQHNKYEY